VYHRTSISLEVELSFDILDPIVLERAVLPAMIEIKAAYAELEKEDGKKARVNVLKVLSESQRMLLEDEITETLREEEP
jgi:hypothetical protein